MHTDTPLESLPERLRKHTEKARVAAKSGDPAYAISLCETLLGQHPGCVEIRQILREAQIRAHAGGGLRKLLGGVSLTLALAKANRLRKSDPARALIEAEKAIGGAPGAATAHKLLGQLALEQKLPQTAVFAFEGLCERQPAKADGWVLLGTALVEAQRAAEAVRVAERALGLDPANNAAQALLKSASVAQTLGSGTWQGSSGAGVPDHIEPAETASREDDETRLHDDPAFIRKRLEKAHAAFAENKEDFALARQIAADHFRLEEWRAAVDWIRRARETPAGKTDETLDRIIFEYEDALWQARESGTLPPPDGLPPEEIASKADAFRAESLGRLVGKYPGEADYRLKLGETLLRLDRATEAAPHFQQAQRDPRARQRALFGLGRAFRQSGKDDLARAQFESLVAEHGAFDEFGKEIHYALADICEALGDTARAAERFKALYAADVAFRDTAERVARYYQ